MRLLRQDLRASGLRSLFVAVALTASVLLVLDWSPAWTFLGAAVGSAGLGLLHHRREVRERVPKGPMEPSSAPGRWDPPARWWSVLLDVALVAVLVAVLVWIVGEEESQFIGALLIGRFAGPGIADLDGVRRVGRWEERHGLRVALRGEDDNEERFAVHPIGLLERR